MTLTRNPTAMMASWDSARSLTISTFKERALKAIAQRPDPAVTTLPHSMNRLMGLLASTDVTVPRAWHSNATFRVDAFPAHRMGELVHLLPELHFREWEGCAVRYIPPEDGIRDMLQISPAIPANKPWIWADCLGSANEASILAMVGPDACVELGPFLKAMAVQDIELAERWTRTLCGSAAFTAGSPMGALPVAVLAEWVESSERNLALAKVVRRNASVGWGVSVRPESASVLRSLSHVLGGQVFDVNAVYRDEQIDPPRARG